MLSLQKLIVKFSLTKFGKNIIVLWVLNSLYKLLETLKGVCETFVKTISRFNKMFDVHSQFPVWVQAIIFSFVVILGTIPSVIVLEFGFGVVSIIFLSTFAFYMLGDAIAEKNLDTRLWKFTKSVFKFIKNNGYIDTLVNRYIH